VTAPAPQAILPRADRLAIAREVYVLIESVFEPWIAASISAERIADLDAVNVERAVADLDRRAEVRWLTPGQSIDFHAVLEPAGLWPAYGAIVAGGTWAAFFAVQRPLGNRAFGDPDRPGRLDRDGVQWWACDPYPCWFRWPDGGELVEAPRGIAWADEPKPFTREPCGYSCRLNSWSDYCHCQGWCL